MNTYKYLLALVICLLVVLLLAGGEPWPEDEDVDDKDMDEVENEKYVGSDEAYYKTCTEDYEGPDCSTSTNKCEQDKPCLNGGTCVSETNDYSCVCTEGFGGRNCEIANKCQYSVECGPKTDAETCFTCRNGFIKDVENNPSCKYGNETLIIVASDKLKLIRLTPLNVKVSQETSIPLSRKKRYIEETVASVDYSFKTGTLFWAGNQNGIIKASGFRVGSKSFYNYREDMAISSLAVDWIYEHLYFVSDKWLVVSNFNGTQKKVLINNFNGSEISIDPFNTRMYWTSSSKTRIEANLDGSNEHEYVSPKTDDLSGLFLDFAKYQSNAAKIGQTFENYIYRANSSEKIYKINKCDEKEATLFYNCECHRITHIMIFNGARQPEGINYCLNSQCSHFCFPVMSSDNGAVSTKCACPDELSLSADAQQCV